MGQNLFNAAFIDLWPYLFTLNSAKLSHKSKGILLCKSNLQNYISNSEVQYWHCQLHFFPLQDKKELFQDLSFRLRIQSKHGSESFIFSSEMTQIGTIFI